MESYGLTPVVELQAVKRDVPYTSQWYPMEYDATGTPAVKLIGDLNYRVTARELHGLKSPWAEGGVHQYGESLFRQCFDNLYRGTERMLCPNPQKLSNNGSVISAIFCFAEEVGRRRLRGRGIKKTEKFWGLAVFT